MQNAILQKSLPTLGNRRTPRLGLQPHLDEHEKCAMLFSFRQATALPLCRSANISPKDAIGIGTHDICSLQLTIQHVFQQDCLAPTGGNRI